MSYGIVQTPAVVTGTTSWQQIGQAVPANMVGAFSLRAANIGSALAYANVRINNGSAQGRRAINFPVPYQDPGSAPDMEEDFRLPAGWWIEVMASAASAIEFTLETVFDNA